MKKIIGLILRILGVLLASFIQIAVIGAMPMPLAYVNVVLIFLIFLSSFFSLETALWWAVGCGFILDIYLYSPFGLNIILFIVIVVVSGLLSDNFFTNRSLFSFLALTAASAFLFAFFYTATVDVRGYFNYGETSDLLSFGFYVSLLRYVAINMFFAMLFFLLMNSLSKRLKPVFIFKRYN